jgi:hypothetical protein
MCYGAFVRCLTEIWKHDAGRENHSTQELRKMGTLVACEVLQRHEISQTCSNLGFGAGIELS